MTSGAKAQTGVVKTSVVTLSGDATGPSNANTVAKINGSPLGTTTGATTGYVLTWNGSAWVPAAGGSVTSVTMGGDVTGNSATSTVAKINGTALGTLSGATSGQYLAWNGTAWVPTTASAAGVTSFNTRTGAVVPANADYLAVATGGLTGATVATRYVGGTANGAPTAGTFAVGDFVVDATASIWICTTAGTPGTWCTAISNHMTLRSATATAKYNEITLFTGSTASQTISAPASPIDSVTWSIINNSSVNVTLGFSSNAMYVLGANTSVTTYTVTPGSAYSFVNYNGGNWYMTSTNDLTNGTGVLPITNGGTGASTAATALSNLGGLSNLETVAGKNFVINGGMDIWQRGTSFAITSSLGYSADRWCSYSASAITISQVASGLTGFQYALRMQRNSGSSTTSYSQIVYNSESKNSYPLAGQTITMSFWARAGTNYSSASNGLNLFVESGTGTDENQYNGYYTGGTLPINTTATLTTSWQKFSYSCAIPSNSTQFGVGFNYTPTGTAGAADYFDITGVQLEIASTATQFSRAGGSIGGELALCQRYYWQVGAGVLCPAVAISTSNLYGYIYTPVSMRLSPPTATAYQLVIQNAGFTGYSSVTTASSLSISNGSSNIVGINYTSNVTSYSVGSNNWIAQNNGSSYLSLSAEL